ncbi:MAG TPA: protein kinase, partial [Thermoanaerobaculia bacterium]|nr:protein kinase [Thermoanaerobaculia bacterium]
MKPDLPADPESWRRIEDLLDEAFERSAGERRAFLDEACAGNPELRAQMEALLAADESAEGFLATPAHQAAAALLADTSDEAARITDRELGPYRLVREIGSGGMGVVYEAEDTRLRRRVAIKLLPPGYGRDGAAKERFLREARVASALDDPTICTVHDVGESDGQLYIVMAYYDGETLKERLARGPLPVSEARQVAIEVARALARAHEAGIVHRDIKPANVMLTRRGKVKILDFGIAKMTGDATLTRAGSSTGTPAYMSPEQARGGPVDGRTDIWSLGALLYEMLAGCRPFPGNDERAVLSAVQGHEPEPLDRIRPEVPPELAQTVVKALAKEPAGRHQSAAELSAELEPSPWPPVVPAHRSWRQWRSFRAILAAVVVVIVSVLLAFLLKKSLWRSPAAPALRVAVLRPATTLAGKNPELAYVASDVVEATLATLISLQGLQPIDPPQPDETSGSAAEKLRRAEANEVVLPLLDCQGDGCRVTLRRLQEPGDKFLGAVGPFEVQAGIENVQRLAEGVRVNLQQLYADRRLRPESKGGRVRPQDYAAYVQLERRVEGGERLGPKELDRLDALLRTSPDLLGAYRMAADIARDLAKVDLALGYVSRAEAIEPNDPRILFSRFHAEMAGNRFPAAQVTLGRLRDLVPGDARVLRAEAELLEARGELKEARRVRQEIVRRRPGWRPILELATLEVRLGEGDSARRRLGELLEAEPGNQRVGESLAFFEASFGDLERAATIYEKLIRLQAAKPYFSDLGFTRFLLGDYAAAESAYRHALALEPHDTLTRFNLATALEAEGKLPKAQRLYRDMAEELAATPNLGDDRIRMLHAQCLARLGRRDDAARLAEEVLKQSPQDVQVINQAAQLYALLGERLSALYYAERALKKGMRREWFLIPEFNSLKKKPGLPGTSQHPSLPPSCRAPPSILTLTPPPRAPRRYQGKKRTSPTATTTRRRRLGSRRVYDIDVAGGLIDGLSAFPLSRAPVVAAPRPAQLAHQANLPLSDPTRRQIKHRDSGGCGGQRSRSQLARRLRLADPIFPGISPLPLELDRVRMDEIIAQFVAAAERGARAGFDHLELHCAHGYLFASFLSPLTNHREDEYGGPIENRLRFPLEVFRALRAVWPAGRPMSVRISASDWQEGGITEDDTFAIAEAFCAAGCDLIDVSAGQTVPDQ